MRGSIVRVLIFAICSSTARADEAQDLAKYLPGSANSIAVVRVAQVLKTERAVTGDWATAMEARFLSGAAAIPPWVSTLVVGSLVRPAVPEEVWSAAVSRLPEGVTLESFATRENMPIDEVGGVPSVRTAGDSFLMQPLPELLAGFRPAHRLEAARWVRGIAANQPSSLSPYLQKAAGNPAHLVLALDFSDLIDVRQLAQLLKEDPRFSEFAAHTDRLVPLLSGLEGVTLAVTVTDVSRAVVTLDFNDNIDSSASMVKTLFVATLDDMGAAIDEFAESQANSDGRAVTLTSELSDESLRRIVSLIVTPGAPPEIASQPTSPPSTPRTSPRTRGRMPQDPTAEYLKAVNQMIDDLQRANRRAKDYARTASWHDNFARKIEALSTHGVDRRAIDFGQRVASQFRALAASLRGEAVEINAQQGTLVHNVDVQPGWFGVSIWGAVGYQDPTVHVTSNLQQVRERQAEAIARGAAEREQIWQMILDERTRIQTALPQ